MSELTTPSTAPTNSASADEVLLDRYCDAVAEQLVDQGIPLDDVNADIAENRDWYRQCWLAGMSSEQTAQDAITEGVGIEVSTCIGCGCTDHNACVDHETLQTCYWLRVDRTQGLGVCSNCHELTLAWDEGDRQLRAAHGEH